MKPFVLGAIFARGGSKGIPGKNIKLLGGKPLIAHAIECAKAVKGIDAVIVSTDDQAIADVAKKWGAEVPFMRPAELATDSAPEILAWKHAIEAYGKLKGKAVDILVSVPATSPLRTAEDVAQCLDALLNSDADGVIVVSEAHRNPYFNMVKLDADGHASLVIATTEAIGGRQSAPQVFDVTTVAYAVRADLIRQDKCIFDGKLKVVKVPAERALDIDTPLDWDMAEFLLKRKAKT